MLGLLSATLLLSLAGQASMQLAGGLSDVKLAIDDPNVQFAVTAINTYYSKLGDAEARTLVDVVSAQSQVVAGTLYHLVLKLKTSSQVELCKVEVWSRPWLSGDEAIQVTKDPSCKMHIDATQAPKITGGSVVVDSGNPEVQKALMFATDSLNKMENSLYYRTPVKIEEVKSQVVSGMAYHFRGVQMAATTCLKSSGAVDLSSCALASPADTRVCDFDVWWQSWEAVPYKLTNYKCQ
ncbi:hypothetical protein EGW08_002576 [Elysia chlorotica]|uniref:Cystatin domain-containing protein n=1 Tax=Elysia chlorotica TaxID=188477 RepID=A0A433U749_ELYCH|nr:hypothetical protein EGW08_002576 [Elysia chlorotica]